MSSIKQKLYEKLGISEVSIKSNKIFTSEISSHKYSQSIQAKSTNSKPGYRKSENSQSLFAHHKMDLLVPNTNAPTRFGLSKSDAKLESIYQSANKSCDPYKQPKPKILFTNQASSISNPIKKEESQSIPLLLNIL